MEGCLTNENDDSSIDFSEERKGANQMPKIVVNHFPISLHFFPLQVQIDITQVLSFFMEYFNSKWFIL